MEKVISEAMVEELTAGMLDYNKSANRFNVGVVVITGTRRNMVECWKKTVQREMQQVLKSIRLDLESS